MRAANKPPKGAETKRSPAGVLPGLPSLEHMENDRAGREEPPLQAAARRPMAGDLESTQK
ncbi:hypothetical protein B9G55_11835 [Saccharibacillus sp. O16]|nr:hypothetical protein B9G55_11835 [Saccharibacillus sp. O16]